MIDDIRAFLESHRAAIPALSGGAPFTISTFHHGHGDASKVLFLIAVNGTPAALGKVMRTTENNHMLLNEYAALTEVSSSSFKLPAPYVQGEVQGFAITFEEVVEGRVVDREDAKNLIATVAAFSRDLSETGSIPTDNVLKLLDADAPEMPRAHELASKVPVLRTAKTHGDLTFRNIIATDQGPALIDWAEYGMRPFKYIDLAHYLLRIPHTDFTHEDISTDEFELLKLIDTMLDRIKKADYTRYASICASFAP